MFSENCSRSLGFRLRAYAVMKTYCKPYGPYAPLRYCPFTLASLLGRRKKGRGGDWRKAQTGKGKGARPFPLFPIPPLPFPLPSNPLLLLTPATQATLGRIPLLEVFISYCL